MLLIHQERNFIGTEEQWYNTLESKTRSTRM